MNIPKNQESKERETDMRKSIILIILTVLLACGASPTIGAPPGGGGGCLGPYSDGTTIYCEIQFKCDTTYYENVYDSNTCRVSGTTCINPPTCCAKQYFYLDADHDGYGKGSSSNFQCASHYTYSSPWYIQSGNYYVLSERATDCNDANPEISPGAAEVCGDRIDNDCDGSVDEGCPVCDTSQGRYADECFLLTTSGIVVGYACATPAERICRASAGMYAWETRTLPMTSPLVPAEYVSGQTYPNPFD